MIKNKKGLLILLIILSFFNSQGQQEYADTIVREIKPIFLMPIYIGNHIRINNDMYDSINNKTSEISKTVRVEKYLVIEYTHQKEIIDSTKRYKISDYKKISEFEWVKTEYDLFNNKIDSSILKRIEGVDIELFKTHMMNENGDVVLILNQYYRL